MMIRKMMLIYLASSGSLVRQRTRVLSLSSAFVLYGDGQEHIMPAFWVPCYGCFIRIWLMLNGAMTQSKGTGLIQGLADLVSDHVATNYETC